MSLNQNYPGINVSNKGYRTNHNMLTGEASYEIDPIDSIRSISTATLL